MGELMQAYAFRGQLALLQNEVEEASRWLELTGEQEVLGPMPLLEDPPIPKAICCLPQVTCERGARASAAHSPLAIC